MQNTMATETFVMDVMATLMASIELWAEQERMKEVKMALYMNLMDKTILVDDEPGRQLPMEYVDDTPTVIEKYLLYMRIEKRTEGTIENYRGELRNFFQKVNKSYADITKNDVMGYLAWKQIVKGNNDRTINNKIHVLKSFYKWVMNEDLIEDGGMIARKPKKDPMAKVNKVKEEILVRSVLTDEQVEIIRCGCITVRDRAIVEVLIATGMRISELVGLNVSDVDVHNGKCKIYGKGRKERAAFFTPKAVVHLKEYLEMRMLIKNVPDDALFLNHSQRRINGVLMYTRTGDCTIRNMLKDIVFNDSRLTGLNLHPHMFRSYLATYMARHGAQLKDIKNVLGHANVNTTLECYIVEDVVSIQEAHGKYAA